VNPSWWLRNLIFVTITPAVAVTMTLASTNAGDGWWPLTAVLTPTCFAAIVAAYLRRTFDVGKPITRDDTPH
jgi:hypothetical protein